MSDLVERLRNYIPGENDDWVAARTAEAADLIEQQAAELTRMRSQIETGRADAIEKCAAVAQRWSNNAAEFNDDPRFQLQANVCRNLASAIRNLAPTPRPSVAAVAEREMVADITFDPTNHHNALKCPYCNPDKLSFTPPDGAIREALEECIETLALVERPAFVDPLYGVEVNALGRRIGFGALMSSASASWRVALAMDGNPVGGEFVAGPCYATVISTLKKARAALALQSKGERG